MRRTRHGVWVVALLMTAACGRDPGLDVRPVANPLGGTAPAAETAIIPLDEVSRSQAGAVAQRVANTEIVVTYSRPVARGRELFGTLVPWDVVWNPGADQATAVSFSRDVRVNGEALAAGTYSLWVIPRADRWTVIFSRAAEVYHEPYPGEAQDALRLEVEPTSGSHMEVLAFDFPEVEGKEAVLRLHWGSVMVPLTITVP
ncbi:MAG: DUF2911 domain-containing protein [Vicinamibacterales bacterium]